MAKIGNESKIFLFLSCDDWEKSKDSYNSDNF